MENPFSPPIRYPGESWRDACTSRRHREAAALFQRALDAAPADARAWFNLGNSQLEDGDPDAAVRSFREAVRVRPAYPTVWRNLGLILTDKANPGRDPAGARKAFEHAVEQTRRRDPIPLLLLALVELELGNVPATKALLEELGALQVTDPRIDREQNELRRALPY
jgi:cytochrome c-type biogenesis protein CcmH/NrfG